MAEPDLTPGLAAPKTCALNALNVCTLEELKERFP